MLVKEKIIQIIKEKGPITVSYYMEICLNAYYNQAAIVGKEGDFITSPENCQTFGEMIAIWLIGCWQQLGRPTKFILCEMGPGRGTLMADILRTVNKLAPYLLREAEIILVETSEHLKAIQQAKLKTYNISWQETLQNLPPLPLLLIANELLDALPIEQYVYRDGKLHPRKIGLNEKDELIFLTDKGSLGNDTIIERSPQQIALIQTIAQYLQKYTGAALFIDYGELDPAYGDTLQAMNNHQYVDVLSHPGNADLTSHVNFYNLSRVAYPCEAFGKTQRQFLLDMGICERAKKLSQHGVERLIDENGMGNLFKVMALAPPNLIPFSFNEKHKIKNAASI